MLVGCILSFAVCSQPTPRPRSSLEYLRAHHAADAALVAGDWRAAREHFEHSLELSPRNATVAYGLACTAARTRKPHEALQWLRRAAEWGYRDADVAAWDRDLASLHDKPAFRDALEIMRASAGGPPAQLALLELLPDSRRTWVRATLRHEDLFAVTLDDRELVILRGADGAELTRLGPLKGEIVGVEFSPSSDDLFALTRSGELWSWKAPAYRDTPVSTKVGGSKELDIFPHRTQPLRLGPKGARLLVAAWEAGAFLLDDGMEPLSDWEDYAVDDHFAWSPDGSRIVEAVRAQLRFRDGRTGELSGVSHVTPSHICAVEFDPTGRWIATGHADAHLRIWDARTLELLHEDEIVDEMFGQPYDVGTLAFSPDGKWIAYATGGGGIRGVVLSLAPFERVGHSEHLGGWMGGPGEVTWSAQSERVWIRGPTQWVFETGSSSETTLRTFRVVACTERSWVATTGRSLLGRAAISGQLLWNVAFLADGRIQQAPSGHFRADPGAFEALVEHEGGLAAWHGQWLPELCDPKRVRAAIVGVPLADAR